MNDDTKHLDSDELHRLLREKLGKRSACFIVIAGQDVGRIFKLRGADSTIGRSEDATIQVTGEGISRLHARVVSQEDGEVRIEDLGSRNGTFVNGESVEVRILEDGDRIQVGGTTILKFSLQDAIEEEFLRKQYESATRDPLTGCYNKRYFLERLPIEFGFAKHNDKSLTLAILDIDHFKKVNDEYGHQAGDFVLCRLAELINKMVRIEDTPVRYGGEEFVLIMREVDLEAAAQVVERVRAAVEEAVFIHEGQELSITISAGVATMEAGEQLEQDELIRRADDLLYEAKAAGRNRVMIARPESFSDI